MQDIYKDALFLESIKSAIVSFGKKNDLNGMDYFAEQLGYNGNNRSTQLHNRLSPTNQEKFLKMEELFSIMAQMDKEDRKIVIDAFAGKYGFFVKEKCVPAVTVAASLETVVTIGALELGGSLGVVNDEIVQSIKDGKIDRDEAKRILRGLRETTSTTRALEDAIIEFLG